MSCQLNADAPFLSHPLHHPMRRRPCAMQACLLQASRHYCTSSQQHPSGNPAHLQVPHVRIAACDIFVFQVLAETFLNPATSIPPNALAPWGKGRPGHKHRQLQYETSWLSQHQGMCAISLYVFCFFFSLSLSFFLGGMGANPRASSPAPVFGGSPVGGWRKESTQDL